MIEIKNISTELIEVIESIDPSVKGCRVVMSPFNSIQIEPGETVAMLGYEPGVSRVIRPVLDPDRPRDGTVEFKRFAEKAEHDFITGFDGQIAT